MKSNRNNTLGLIKHSSCLSHPSFSVTQKSDSRMKVTVVFIPSLSTLIIRWKIMSFRKKCRYFQPRNRSVSWDQWKLEEQISVRSHHLLVWQILAGSFSLCISVLLDALYPGSGCLSVACTADPLNSYFLANLQQTKIADPK